MIPRTIRFTGLDIDPMAVLSPRNIRGIVPPDWSRVCFETDQRCSERLLNRWIGANMEGRWHTTLVCVTFGKRMIAIAFETDTDAVMFRLKNGETAWKELKTGNDAF